MMYIRPLFLVRSQPVVMSDHFRIQLEAELGPFQTSPLSLVVLYPNIIQSLSLLRQAKVDKRKREII
jgi:hypothetical protein